MIRHWLLASLMLLAVAAVPQTARCEDKALGLKVYSDLHAIEAEGEFIGLQVAIVPYSAPGETVPYGVVEKVLWRPGSGRLDPPLLLDAVRDGKVRKVTIPEGNDDHGEWTLTLEGTVLHVQGPRGQRTDLQEIPFK